MSQAPSSPQAVSLFQRLPRSQVPPWWIRRPTSPSSSKRRYRRRPRLRSSRAPRPQGRWARAQGQWVRGEERAPTAGRRVWSTWQDDLVLCTWLVPIHHLQLNNILYILIAKHIYTIRRSLRIPSEIWLALRSRTSRRCDAQPSCRRRARPSPRWWRSRRSQTIQMYMSMDNMLYIIPTFSIYVAYLNVLIWYPI